MNSNNESQSTGSPSKKSVPLWEMVFGIDSDEEESGSPEKSADKDESSTQATPSGSLTTMTRPVKIFKLAPEIESDDEDKGEEEGEITPSPRIKTRGPNKRRFSWFSQPTSPPTDEEAKKMQQDALRLSKTAQEFLGPLKKPKQVTKEKVKKAETVASPQDSTGGEDESGDASK